jgi:hypothetical protein
MKRTLSLLAALSVIAAASFASARPGSSFDHRRAPSRAQLFAQRTHGILARARAHRIHEAQRRAALERLRALTASVQRFRRYGARIHRAPLRAELGRIEAQFAEIQAQAAWLPSHGDVDELARRIAELRQMVASYAPVPPAPVTYTPYPPIDPPRTSVYTNGASVTWY